MRRAVRLAEGDDVHEVVTPEHRREGPRAAQAPARESPSAQLDPGVATGLAWTPGGGEILFIEATKMPGKGNIVLTGNMRNVMQESATTAVSFVRSKADRLHLDSGVAQAHRPARAHPAGRDPEGRAERRRHDVHRGRVAPPGLLGEEPTRDDRRDFAARPLMPVGGIKEKLLAAHRAGMKARAHPGHRTQRDLEDVPLEVRDDLDINSSRRTERSPGGCSTCGRTGEPDIYRSPAAD